jgi:hypothetical protein
MVNQVLKWVFLLCVASLILNGLLYWVSGSRDVLTSTYGTAALGAMSAIGLLFARSSGESLGVNSG